MIEMRPINTSIEPVQSPSPDTPIEKKSITIKSRAIVAAKMLFVAIVVAGLVAATVFSGFALAGLIAAGAAFWQVGFVTVGCVGSGITTLGALFFAGKNESLKWHYFIRNNYVNASY